MRPDRRGLGGRCRGGQMSCSGEADHPGMAALESISPARAGAGPSRRIDRDSTGAADGGAARVGFTVDVEEWFHAHALGIGEERWADLGSRVDDPVDWLLAELAGRGARGTFFVVGWLAERRPDLVRRIAAAGHELASHSYWHRPATKMSRAAFLADAQRSKQVIEDIAGCAVLGYRAPSYTLTRADRWAFDALLEAGYSYDSSIYPARSPRGAYGDPSAPREPFEAIAGLREYPMSVCSIMRWRVPVASGGYLRLLPWRLTRRAILSNLRASIPVVINVHPWELDPEHVSLCGRRAPLTHRVGLRSTRRKVAAILAEFDVQALADRAGSEATRPSEMAVTAVDRRGDARRDGRADQAVSQYTAAVAAP